MNAVDLVAVAIVAVCLWDAARRFTDAKLTPAQVKEDLQQDLTHHKEELSKLFDDQRQDLANQIKDAAQARALAPKGRKLNITGARKK